MSITKELIVHERQLVDSGHYRDLHLHREGTFLRANGSSVSVFQWSTERFVHSYKVYNLLIINKIYNIWSK